jgi:hypothetical protein
LKLAPSSFIVVIIVDAIGATFTILPVVTAEQLLVAQRTRRPQSGECQMGIRHGHEEAYGPFRWRTVDTGAEPQMKMSERIGDEGYRVIGGT